MNFKPKFENYGDKLQLPENLRQFDTIMLKLSDILVGTRELHQYSVGVVMLVAYTLMFPIFQLWVLTSNIRFESVGFFGVVMFISTLVLAGWVLSVIVLGKESDLALQYSEGRSKQFLIVTIAGLGVMTLNQFWRGLFGAFILIVVVAAVYILAFLCRYYIAVVYDGIEGHPDTSYDPDKGQDETEDGWGRYEVEYEYEEENEDYDPESDKVWNMEVRRSIEEAKRDRMMQGRRK